VSFLYPLFLLAGLTVAIPVLIHLFNLRRYKTVYFPSTRFLKNVQLHSQKQSNLRYKWLLLLRILFLLSLILAFAQPFFSNNSSRNSVNRLQVIFIDNSSSMSLKKGPRDLLDIAKETARKQLLQAPPEARFILLTNNKPVSYQPMPAEKALAALNTIELSPISKSSDQIFTLVEGLVQSEAADGADVFYYSDFQQNSFAAQVKESQLKNIRFIGVPLRTKAPGNIYIDTAFLASPSLQTGQNNRLIVKSKRVGKPTDEPVVVQLRVNDQVKSAVSLEFDAENQATDTLSFQVNNTGWQNISLTINDAAVRFDDTFRIAARSASNLSVLVLNEGPQSPYIQAAFRAYSGFRMVQQPMAETADWKNYNLIILQGITTFNDQLVSQVISALQQGRSICIFPGKTSNYQSLSNGLNKIAELQISGLDTAVQTASNLIQGSDLVRDLFDRVPENVQLPVANWHYILSSGLRSNQQSVLSFRNGDPFIAQYNPSRGKLYVSATAINLNAGNFPESYFFVPFLYQMATQSGSGDVFAITAGKQQPVFLSLQNTDDRNMVHVYANSLDLIPPQRASGAGVEVFLGEAVQQPGFYTLAAERGDSTNVAVNASRLESQLALWDLDVLRQNWKGENISWSDENLQAAKASDTHLPLWKVCVILALLMLAAESYLLAAGYRKQTLAPR